MAKPRIVSDRDRRRCAKGSDIETRLNFWSIPEPMSGCYLWLGYVNDAGYGIIHADGVVEGAHRVRWRQRRGEIPEGMQVLHKCDTPCCIAFEHLFVGTHQDNMADMAAKGRAKAWRGEKNWNSKLTADQVMEIRADQRVHQLIADDYGVSQVQISNIKRGDSWSSLPGDF